MQESIDSIPGGGVRKCITPSVSQSIFTKKFIEAVMRATMSSPFALVAEVVAESLPKPARHRGWRAELREVVGPNLHQVLWDLAQGKAWTVELTNGMISAPIVPSSDVRLRAAMFLHETLYGRAVPQTEVARAEQEAKEVAAVQALSEEELALEATRILEARKLRVLGPGAVTEAEFVPSRAGTVTNSMTPIELGYSIWASQPHPDVEDTE